MSTQWYICTDDGSDAQGMNFNMMQQHLAATGHVHTQALPPLKRPGSRPVVVDQTDGAGVPKPQSFQRQMSKTGQVAP